MPDGNEFWCSMTYFRSFVPSKYKKDLPIGVEMNNLAAGEVYLPGTLGTLLETFPQEGRVALIPRQCEALRKAGLEVIIEQSAGVAAGFPNELYVARGARIGSREKIFQEADILAQVRCLGD